MLNRTNTVCEFLNKTTIEVPSKLGGEKFSFDRIFDSDSTQEQLFDDAIEPIVSSVMDGYNGTVLAYGQTGSGKTWSMLGDLDDPI